jgi:hypothetical protein
MNKENRSSYRFFNIFITKTMKKLLLLTALLIGSFAQAQEFSNITSTTEAIKQASILASNSNNSKFLNSKSFAEEHLFAVRFIAPEMSAAEYEKLDTSIQNQLLTVIFKIIGDKYVFDGVTASYDVLFKVWQTAISKQETPKDNQNKKYFDKENKIVYYFSEDNDERWKISRHSL